MAGDDQESLVTVFDEIMDAFIDEKKLLKCNFTYFSNQELINIH